MKASSLAKMDMSELGLTPEQMAQTLSEIHEFADRVAQLPVLVRQLMVIIARRATRPGGINMSLELALHEIQQVTGLRESELLGHLEMLDRYGFLREGFPNEVGQPPVKTCDLKSGWPISKDLVSTCNRHQIPLEDIVVRLRFNLLD